VVAFELSNATKEITMPSASALRRLLSGVSLITAALIGACGGDSGDTTTGPGPGPAPSPGPEPGPSTPGLEGRVMFGLTCSNTLVQFGSGNPGTIARQVAVTGMPAGAVMLGIEFRGNNGLYGVGSDSRVYTIDTLSGAATAVGDPFSPAVNGEHFGLAYSASQDRLQLSSVEGNQNLSLDPSTGAVASADPDMAFAAGDVNEGGNPAITGTAFLENGGGSTLYAVDATANALVRVSATGEIVTVGGFGFNVYLCSGLDIDSDGTAYAALATDGGSELYTLDLSSGAASYLGEIGATVHSIALP
jgi:Domain of unknown function (DUF4394)